MSQPYRGQVHVDRPLTNISIAYLQSQTNFIASRVFPVVPVDKQSDSYFVYRKNDWFRDEAQRRAPATESAGSGYNIDTDTYNCEVWAFHKDIDNQTAANSDIPLNPERDAAQFVMQRMLLRQEVQWASDYFKTGVWGKDYTGVSGTPGSDQFKQWSDYTSSDPVDDIETGKAQILSTTGFLPNTLVLGYEVFRKLKNHPDIVDRVKYTSSENITEAMLARMFEVDNVYVAKAVKATNNEGETAAYSFVHSKAALLCYVNPTPSLLQPSAGYTFMWRGISQGLGTTVATSRIEMPLVKAVRIESEMAWDNKVVATDLGCFFATAVA